MCTSRQVIDPGGLLFGDKTGKYADPLGITKTAVGDPTGRVRRARKEAEDERRTYASSGASSVAYRSLAPTTTALGGTAPRNTVLGGG
ncbi:hypothetical protein [Stenotrophomonas pavanii]|uniref:hypothetical protein n=1 Tax=Stenotrophomonas pavanii TaxID=487698 RepID=UPI0028B114BA|nr:hypothetical protein [Stenotrophomonas pavanii]